MDRTLRFAWRASLIAFGALAAVFACSGSGDDSSFSNEGEACSTNGDCGEGLVCQFDVCVVGNAAGGSGGGTNGRGGTSSKGGASTKGGASNGGEPAVGGDGTANNNGGSPTGSAGASSSSGGAGGAVSAGGAGGAGPDCDGSHPLLGNDPPTRYCGDGDCYCPGADKCLAENIAAQCCENDPLCGDDGGLAGIDCSSMHPIIGPPRTCQSGYCLCSEQNVIDACFPSEVAQYCCPPSVELQCVP